MPMRALPCAVPFFGDSAPRAHYSTPSFFRTEAVCFLLADADNPQCSNDWVMTISLCEDHDACALPSSLVHTVV